MQHRGDHTVVTADMEGVHLRAVSWHEGKRDKKTKQIVRKNFVGSFSTTLEGRPHRKRRWVKEDDGSTTETFYDVKRPRLVTEYFDGAQTIDVHNHRRQGSLGMELRPTKRWEWRFFQTFLGINVIDSFLAYIKFAPGKELVTRDDFVQGLIDHLLNNKYGVTDAAPVLRPHAADYTEDDQMLPALVHVLEPLRATSFFQQKNRRKRAAGLPPRACSLRCRICGAQCLMHCAKCSSTHPATSKQIQAICGPNTGRGCFEQHQRNANAPSPAAATTKAAAPRLP